MSRSSIAIAPAAEAVIEEKIGPTGTAASRPSVLLSRTSMNQNTRNALSSLVEHGMLAEFWTTFAWDCNSRWNRVLPGRLRAQLGRRRIEEAPAAQVRTSPWREVMRLALSGTPAEALLCRGARPFSSMKLTTAFDGRVARRLGQLRPGIVYGYEDGVLETFREARKQGIVTVDEYCSNYWRSTRVLFAEEAERKPELANLLVGLEDNSAQLERKDEELRLADYVFVASEHVVRTFGGVVPREKIRVIPYGAPPVRPRLTFSSCSSRPLQVLYVANLSQHKGIGYVLDAMELLGSRAELTMVGRRVRPNARVDEACRRWRWFASLPHDKVLELMQQSDVLVLPSLSDAFGLVVTEALASGLPVIATRNTGAMELIVDGRDGFVVPVCNAEAIAAKLEMIHWDREMLVEMSRQAQVTAAENSWENYRANWARALRSLPCL